VKDTSAPIVKYGLRWAGLRAPGLRRLAFALPLPPLLAVLEELLQPVQEHRAKPEIVLELLEQVKVE
jgi:hypothetical protein